MKDKAIFSNYVIKGVFIIALLILIGTMLVAHKSTEVHDNIAILNSISNLDDQGILNLAEGENYILSETINIDLSKIKGIEGNGANVIVTGDFPAFSIKGDPQGGGGAPTDEKRFIAAKEHNSFIRDIQFYSLDTLGAGLEIENTWALKIVDNSFFNMKNGLIVNGYHNNLKINNNYFYDLTSYGVHFHSGFLHQTIINSNHFNDIGKHNIFWDDGDYHNISIVSNVLESRDAGILKFYLSEDSNNTLSQVQIVGNNIESHRNNNTPLVEFINQSGNVENMKIISITGNEFSGSDSPALSFNNVREWVVNDNNFHEIQGYSIETLSNVHTAIIQGNSFYGDKVKMGFLHMSGGHSDSLEGVIVNSNSISTSMDQDILIVKGEDPANKYKTIAGLDISHNIINYKEEKLEDEIFVFNISHDIESIIDLSLTNNRIILNNPSPIGAVKVNAVDVSALLIKYNGLINSSNTNPYYIPQDNGTNILTTPNQTSP